MPLGDRIARLVEAFRTPSTRLVEASGVTIDDEEGWRKLTGDPTRDIGALTQSRAQDLAVYVWRTNPIANRLVELPVAYLLSEGVRLTAPDEDAQRWLDAFWCDPINCWDLKLANKVRELALFGEQCWPVFVNEITGAVRLATLDPGIIATVVTDPDNIEQPIGVITKRDSKGMKRRYRVIVNGPENVFTRKTQAIRESFTEGDCFYFAVNKLSNASRGVSDLLPALDWLDAYDKAMFGELERWDMLRAFIWDVTLTGADADQVAKRAREISPPKPGSARVHNEQESWDAQSPSLQGGDTSATARMFRNHILGGATIPEHWFGGGGDVNRATAGEMGEPVAKVLSMRQRVWRHILEEVGTYAIRQRLRVLFGADPEQSGDPGAFRATAEFPEMIVRDTTKYAAALQQVATAAIVAVDRGLLSEETAVGLIGVVAGRLGLEIDPAEELARAREDGARKREEDGFTLGDTQPGGPNGGK